MKILLDTNALIWFLQGSDRLSSKAKEVIENLSNERFVSIVSIWEIIIKASLGKLEFKSTVDDIKRLLVSNNIELIEIKLNHLNILQILPHHHRDPFDRLIISQAITENLSVITADRHFDAYQLDIVAQ